MDTQGIILGVIAWGAVGPEDTLGREGEALLHGIYVDPAFQGLGSVKPYSSMTDSGLRESVTEGSS